MPVIAEQPSTQRRAEAAGFSAAPRAATLLRTSATIWTGIALAGQLFFALYVSVLYGRPALSGDFAAWSKGPVARAWLPGQTVGNAAFGVHIGLAVLIILAGAVQLLPVIRRRWPTVHRWSGRSYLSAAFVTSLAGLYMVWVRGSAAGDLPQHIAISLNAVILVTCAAFAWRTARARDFAAHRQWALRTYLAAGGVFFFRIFLMLWFLVWQRPVGMDPDTFSGPFLTTLAFAVYVVGPLTLLECYLRAQRSGRPAVQLAVAGGLGVLSLMTIGGILGATMGMWLPRMG